MEFVIRNVNNLVVISTEKIAYQHKPTVYLAQSFSN